MVLAVNEVQVASSAGTNIVDYSPLYGKVMLLDADICLFRAACAAEKKHYLLRYSDGSGSEYESAKEAKAAQQPDDYSIVWNRTIDRGSDFALDCLHTILGSLTYRAQPSSTQLWLSGEESFRKELAFTKPYKGGRPERPKHYKIVREALLSEYGARESEHGMEADDILSIRNRQLGEESFICSIDKDMEQLPGWKFNWVQDRVYRVSAKDADFNFYTQLCVGDSVDNVPGLTGVGPAGARKLLEGAKNTGDLFARVWSEYRARCSGTIEEIWEYYLEQANLLFLLRDPYDEREGLRFYQPPYVPEEIVKELYKSGPEDTRRKLDTQESEQSSAEPEGNGDLSLLI
jgi:hypothetical protein